MSGKHLVLFQFTCISLGRFQYEPQYKLNDSLEFEGGSRWRDEPLCNAPQAEDASPFRLPGPIMRCLVLDPFYWLARPAIKTGRKLKGGPHTRGNGPRQDTAPGDHVCLKANESHYVPQPFLLLIRILWRILVCLLDCK